MELFPLSVYPILDMDTCRSMSVEPASLVGLWQDLGIGRFQLRYKNTNASRYMDLAETLQTSYPSMSIIANDRFDCMYLRPGLFSGLHLGQEDIQDLNEFEWAALKNGYVEAEHRWLRGISTHNREQVMQAVGQRFWDYIAIGPVRPTTSKPSGKDPVIDPGELQNILNYIWTTDFREKPIVLIGGIDDAALGAIRSTVSPEMKLVAAVIRAATSKSTLLRLLAAQQSER